MSEQFEELAAALLKQRDIFITMLSNMERTHKKLLNTLADMEARFKALEQWAADPAHPLDPNTMNADQLATLGERLWEASPLKNTVEAHVDTWLDSELEGRMSDYVGSLEIEVDVDASIRDRN